MEGGGGAGVRHCQWGMREFAGRRMVYLSSF
jgi:hypothetical protein